MAGPVVKWVGGKARLLPTLSPLLPPAEDISHYAEPFVGGGAMLFHIAQRWPKDRQTLFRWNINDTNVDLISFYKAVGSYSSSVADIACRFASAHCATTYKLARTTFNDLRPFVGEPRLWAPELAALHAGLFLYLNKCGFNGLYRTNGAGDFNVSPNPNATWRPKRNELVDELVDAAVVLKSCISTTTPSDVFVSEQLKHSLGIIEPKHVFFFVDPPYLNDEQDGFTGYGKERWTTTDLMTLSLSLQQIHEEGARFMLTHADTELVRDLFDNPDYNLTELSATQTISTTASGRGERKELVIRNYR